MKKQCAASRKSRSFVKTIFHVMALVILLTMIPFTVSRLTGGEQAKAASASATVTPGVQRSYIEGRLTNTESGSLTVDENEVLDFYRDNIKVFSAKLVSVDIPDYQIRIARNDYRVVWFTDFTAGCELTKGETLDVYRKGTATKLGTYKVTQIVVNAFQAANNIEDASKAYTNDGDHPWIISVYDGDLVAKSGNREVNNSTSSMSYTIDCSVTTTVSFRYMALGGLDNVSDNDKCQFFIDGQRKFQYYYRSYKWYTYKFAMEPGTHTLTWKYIKDETGSSGADCFMIDNLLFSERDELTLDANGGKFTDGSSAITVEVNAGYDYEFAEAPQPTRKGYRFCGYTAYANIEPGWSSLASYEGNPSGNRRGGKMTVYARWEKLRTDTVMHWGFEPGEPEWSFNTADYDFRYCGWSTKKTDRQAYLGQAALTMEFPKPVDGYYAAGSTRKVWAVSSPVKLDSDKLYGVRFRVNPILYTDQNLEILAGTTPDISSMIKLGDTETFVNEAYKARNYEGPVNGIDPDQGWTMIERSLEEFRGGTVYIAFVTDLKENETLEKAITIDDVEIYQRFLDVQPLSDKGKDPYYYDAVYWAAGEGITGGVKGSDGVARYFYPQDTCTRAQMVSFLWRMAGCPAPKTETDFPDVSKKAYYYKAVCWAQENGITGGYPDGTFGPNKSCNRAQAVSFLYRMAGQPEVTANSNFKDVKRGAYYYNAVSWAEQAGITGGYSDNTFRPNNNCSRAQMVTFLYRYNNYID